MAHLRSCAGLGDIKQSVSTHIKGVIVVVGIVRQLTLLLGCVVPHRHFLQLLLVASHLGLDRLLVFLLKSRKFPLC